jgi:hypothetical protein
VQDLHVVECFKAFYNLNKNTPNLFFFEVGLFFLVFCDFLEEISRVSIFHYDTVKSQKLASTYHKDWEGSSINASW